MLVCLLCQAHQLTSSLLCVSNHDDKRRALAWEEREIDRRHILPSTQVEQNSFSSSFSFLTGDSYFFFFFSFVNLIFTDLPKILVIDFTIIMRWINAQSFCPRATFKNKIVKR